MKGAVHEGVITLEPGVPPWERVFAVGPPVMPGPARRGEGYDPAPKSAAFPLGWSGYFGFACTPRHGTYRNVRREEAFTVSYPVPTEVVLGGLAAAARGRTGPRPRSRSWEFPGEQGAPRPRDEYRVRAPNVLDRASVPALRGVFEATLHPEVASRR